MPADRRPLGARAPSGGNPQVDNAQIALSLSIALALGVVIGLAMTALVFRIDKQPLLPPLRPLTLTATDVGAGIMVASASALPWVRITCRPELLRME